MCGGFGARGDALCTVQVDSPTSEPAGFFVCKLKKMSNSKKETAAEGAEGQAEPQDPADAPGVPNHDGTPSKLFPTAKGDKAAKRKGELQDGDCTMSLARVEGACAPWCAGPPEDSTF